VTFDIGGGTLSATATVSAALANGPGSGAPGWLRLGRPMGSLPAASPFGLAVSVDLANQVLFNVWGQGALAQTIPDPTVGMLQTAPALPPVLLPDGHGGVTFAMGEVVVQATVGGQTLSAGVSIVTDVDLSVGMSPSALLLTPKGTPQVSLTWLQASGLPDSLKQSLAASAASEVAGLIQPLVIPLPSIPLDALSPSLAGKVAAFAPGATVAFDTPSGRADLSGAMAITP
jgi:hypothetical protein